MLPETYHLGLFTTPVEYSYKITPAAQDPEKLLRSWNVFSQVVGKLGLTPMWGEDGGAHEFWFDSPSPDAADAIEMTLRRRNTMEDIITGAPLFRNIPYYNQHQCRPHGFTVQPPLAAGP